MLPLRDVNPTQSRPFVTWLLVLANVAAFLWMSSMPPWYAPAYGLVPTRLVADPPGEAFTILTSMFMHGGLAHLLGNMLFLWIFGDNVEDSIGHSRYLALYLASGLAAGLAQVGTNVASPIPMVGASGAIAGVTGAYVLLFPRAPILVLNPIPPLWLVTGVTFMVPAWLIAGEFFVMNLLSGIESLGNDQPRGGVAFFAHLGGFLAGLVLLRPMMRGRARRRQRDWEGWRTPRRQR